MYSCPDDPCHHGMGMALGMIDHVLEFIMFTLYGPFDSSKQVKKDISYCKVQTVKFFFLKTSWIIHSPIDAMLSLTP